MNGYAIQQSTASQPLVFLMIDSSDHVSGKTGLSPTVTISKNGGAFASPAGSVTEIGSGLYKVAANAGDSDTLGPLVLHATATGADPTDWLYPVVAYDPLTVAVGALRPLVSGRQIAVAATTGIVTAELDPAARVKLDASQPDCNVLRTGVEYQHTQNSSAASTVNVTIEEA